MDTGGVGGGGVPDVSLLLLGEFQSVAEDLDSLLFKSESTCLGRLTVDTEHLPKKPRERHRVVHTGQMVERKKGEVCGAMKKQIHSRPPCQTFTRLNGQTRTVPFLCARSHTTPCLVVQYSLCDKPL